MPSFEQWAELVQKLHELGIKKILGVASGKGGGHFCVEKVFSGDDWFGWFREVFVFTTFDCPTDSSNDNTYRKFVYF